MEVYDLIQSNIGKRPMLALLVDPDKVAADNRDNFISSISTSQADLIFVGGSLIFSSVEDLVLEIKSRTSKPVVLFPGLSSHFTSQVDAVLFLSLLSGRNPDFLIGNQVHAAIPILRSKVEVIPTAYILIEGGSRTSVEYMSNTMPIPAAKNDIALATAAAAKLLGFKMIYLETGSGAREHVPLSIIGDIKTQIGLPLIVGGGIKTEEALSSVLDAGADIVVVGTAFEENEDLIDRFCKVVRRKEKKDDI